MEGRDKGGERKRWGFWDRGNSTRERHGGEKEKTQIWMMVNSRMRGRKREDQERAERMSEGRDTEIQRDRGRKNKCKPLRINSLISLRGRMEKRGFPPPILSASL